MMYPLHWFRKKHVGRVSVIFHTINLKHVNRVKKFLNRVRDRFDIADSYVVYYGSNVARVFSPIPIYYYEEPYARGSALYSGSKLASSNILLYIDLGTRCLDMDEVVQAFEKIHDGEILAYMAGPWGNESIFNNYKQVVEELGGESPLLKQMISPAYSIILVLEKLLNKHSFWSIEPFIVHNASVYGSASVLLSNKCIDGFKYSWLEKHIYLDLREKLKQHVASTPRIEKYLVKTSV